MSKNKFEETIAKVNLSGLAEEIQATIKKLTQSNITTSVLIKKGVSLGRTKQHLLSAKQELNKLIEAINKEHKP